MNLQKERKITHLWSCDSVLAALRGASVEHQTGGIVREAGGAEREKERERGGGGTTSPDLTTSIMFVRSS